MRPKGEGKLLVLDVIRALGRRWYVVLIGAIVTAGLTVGAYLTTPPEYNARALVLLLPSETAVGEGGNPFLTLDGLEQPAGILVAYFSSAPAREEVKEQSETAQYVVGIDDSTRGPVIAVDVTDTSNEKALDTLAFITDRIPIELAALQDQVDAPADAVITSIPLTVDQKAERSMSGTIRMMIAALVVGIAATCITAFALDGLIRRRQLRQSGELPKQPERAMKSTASKASKKNKTPKEEDVLPPEASDEQVPVSASAGREP
ncbi:hypothetical protein GCM10007198_03820 [Microbacterium aerolatum]|uniref:Polysaccharide chain length determinant N-terminal domain-containing protein n=2 Tax=Microbacterium aerolatum TaxID=153731 RepID=A0A511ADY9_9MICO|nr:hypothetical protein MAE01_14280 [Microbacterium aerolatum]GGB16462.1 hypothetical protein GCM10007198_03820 [Microbacterium aerolatum]